MIIPTDLAIAFVCPYCGRQVYDTFSLFRLKPDEELDITCACGGRPCAVGLEGGNLIYVILWGKCCEDPHEFDFYLDEFQTDALLGLACDTSSLGLGFIGSPRLVKIATEECVLPTPI